MKVSKPLINNQTKLFIQCKLCTFCCYKTYCNIRSKYVTVYFDDYTESINCRQKFPQRKNLTVSWSLTFIANAFGDIKPHD